ncbi:MAG TPA: hypothetical protein VGA40_04720 [Candidatus Acidoferrales bacterium]
MKGRIALLAIGLIAAIAAGWYVRSRLASHAGPVPELLRQLPADATLYAYADLTALRQSPFLHKLDRLTAPQQTDAEYDAFVRATGFDYTRDLDRIALAARQSPQQLLLIAEGRFDRQRITDHAKRTGRSEQQDGREVLIVPTAEPGRVMAFTFLDANRILFVDAAVIPQIEVKPFDGELIERISLVSGSAIFAVGRLQSGPPIPLGGFESPTLLQLLASIRWASLAAQPVGERLRIALDTDCDTPENANQLAGTLDGFRLLARAALADPKNREGMPPATYALLDAMLRDADVSRTNHRVRVTFEVNAAALDALAPPAEAAPGKRAPASK